MKREELVLKNAARIEAGYPFRGKIPEDATSEVLAVQMKDTHSQTGVDWESCIRTELTGKQPSQWLEEGDILLAARGNQNYAVLINASIGERRAVAAPHFFVIRCDRELLLPEFLHFLLNSASCQRYFQRESEGTLTKSIRRSTLENAPIAIPDLQTQYSLVRLSETLFEERRQAEALIRNGDQILNAIANDLFKSFNH